MLAKSRSIIPAWLPALKWPPGSPMTMDQFGAAGMWKVTRWNHDFQFLAGLHRAISRWEPVGRATGGMQDSKES